MFNKICYFIRIFLSIYKNEYAYYCLTSDIYI